MNKEFKWKYCPTCNVMTVICWKCGNNCCNAGRGEVNGEKCNVCPSAYEYMKNNERPDKPDDWEYRFRKSYIMSREIFAGKMKKNDFLNMEKIIQRSKQNEH